MHSIRDLKFYQDGTAYIVELTTEVDGSDFGFEKITHAKEVFTFKGTNNKLRALQKVVELATV